LVGGTQPETPPAIAVQRLAGEEAFEPVAWQMPDAVFRVFQTEARRRGTDLNSLVRDFVCEALSDRAAAIKHINAERKRTIGNE